MASRRLIGTVRASGRVEDHGGLRNVAALGGVKLAAYGYRTRHQIQFIVADALHAFSWIRGIGFDVNIYDDTLVVRFLARLTRSAIEDAHTALRAALRKAGCSDVFVLTEPDPRTVEELVEAVERETPAADKVAARMIAHAYAAFQRSDLLEAHASYLVALDTCLDAGDEKIAALCRASAKGVRRAIRSWRLMMRKERRGRVEERRIAASTMW